MSSPFPTLDDTLDEFIQKVEAYANAGDCRAYQPTTGTRRVIAALRGIGLARETFRVRSACNSKGEYQPARFSVRTATASDTVREHAELLVLCGISVHLDAGYYTFGQIASPAEIHDRRRLTR